MKEALQLDGQSISDEDYQNDALQVHGDYHLDALQLFNDNLGTVQTINNPEATSGRSKHIDTRYFRIRQHVQRKDLRVAWIETNFNVGDFFTKALKNPKFRFFCDVIGLQDLD